ncbi:MAG: tyrosine-type recombinase/integrase, partial [Oxalobacter sp.]
YRTGLSAFRCWCAACHVSAPSDKDVSNFRSWLLEHYRLSTAQTYLVAVKLFFAWLNKHNLYGDVAAGIQRIKVNYSVPMRDYLSVKEIRTLLRCLARQSAKTGSQKDLRNYVMILLILACGLRVSEVAKLDVNDLYNASGTFCLRIHGKGRDGKSDTATVPETIAAEVFRWFDTRASFGMEQPMFVSLGHSYVGKRLCSRTISQIVKHALRQAGFDSPRLTAHSLRHSAVTLALQGGATLQEAQQFARHSRIETTQIYAHNLEVLNNPCSKLVADIALGRADRRFSKRLPLPSPPKTSQTV